MRLNPFLFLQLDIGLEYLNIRFKGSYIGSLRAIMDQFDQVFFTLWFFSNFDRRFPELIKILFCLICAI